MDVKIFIIFVLITTVQCRFNRDGYAKMDQHGRKAPSDAAAAANQQHERERRQLTSEQYALRNQPSYAPTEAPSETQETLHFEKEIKEAKDAMSIMVGYIALTIILVTIISCCCIACIVITVALVWSSRETPNNNKKEQQQQHQVVQPQYPPPQPWLLPPPQRFYDDGYFPEVYKGEPRIYPVVSRTDIYASDSRPKVYRKSRPKVRSIASRSSVYPSDS